MSFALTKAQFRSLSLQNVSYKKGVQEVVLEITAANTDTDLDIGDAAGTFWTAAVANATYGAMAALVLAQLQAVVASSAYFSQLRCPELQCSAYLQVASAPGATQYSLTTDTYGPDILLASGSAPTSYHVHLFYELAVGAFPISANYNIT